MGSTTSSHGALPPQLDVDTAHSRFYQPPASPSASASLQSSILLSTPSLDISSALSTSTARVSSNTSRKRSRNDFAENHTPHPCAEKMRTPHQQPQWSYLSRDDALSPPPLADSRYLLAGGGLLGTPTAVGLAQSPSSDFDATPEVAFRRGRGYGHEATRRTTSGGWYVEDDYFGHAIPPTSFNVEPNALKRRREDGLHWPRAVLSTAIAVVGGVWSFCTTPFRGFNSGHDRPYPLDPPLQSLTHPSPESSSTASEQAFGIQSVNSSVWAELPPPSSGPATPRAAKKSKLVHTPGAEEPRGWMLVSGDGGVRSASPSSASAAHMRRPGMGNRRDGVTSIATGFARPASAAGLRSSLVRPSPLTSHARRRSRDKLLGASARASPVIGNVWQGNDASPQLKGGSGGSPAAKEAAKYVQKLKKRERKEERELKRFNRQLEDMIREGQEALGARIEVADTTDDEGGASGMEWA